MTCVFIYIYLGKTFGSEEKHTFIRNLFLWKHSIFISKLHFSSRETFEASLRHLKLHLRLLMLYFGLFLAIFRLNWDALLQGSCSRIWQRDSYWDARPSSRRYVGWRYFLTWERISPPGDWDNLFYCSNEYPLFIPRQNYCSTSGENSWSDRSSSNFGVASIDSERKPHLDSSGSSSFNYSSASQHSVETHQDLQRGISLLKKSVACITAYCYNSLCLDVPSETSTFEAFAKLLATLSSSKEVHSVFSLKMACSRYIVLHLLSLSIMFCVLSFLFYCA